MTYSDETRQICLRLYVEYGHDVMPLIRGLFGVAPTLYGWFHSAVYKRTIALHTRKHKAAAYTMASNELSVETFNKVTFWVKYAILQDILMNSNN